MNDHSPGGELPDSKARLAEVESLLMHTQHELEQLGEVLLKQMRQLETIERKLNKFENRVEKLEDDPENRDPTAEKPPHY
ncbi:SlyX family protein [Stratiformator vulcanicus]|uniref:Protein SlyX n=1 Tax=Stratiformator vulcanicus TaxID=2527980 RepID=A0A517QZU1_9PLAN|nr:SlyX family protein [Stratiformator vulcanicus]QDT37151.1 hypothetical protein Pan189_15210 [Stratiformator vulcanicus]